MELIFSFCNHERPLQLPPLRIHPLLPGPNVFYGHAVLDQLGLDLPLVDLLVREVIQNSLDASEDDVKVKVGFRIRTMDPSVLCDLLEATDRMKLPEGDCHVLEISDEGTVGLSGQACLADCSDPASFGRFVRLVYSMGVNQTAQGAGGSHGIGKSICYHLGAGLVFFHTRFTENGLTRERLAACWVEDHQQEGGVLASLDAPRITTGVCWWGEEERGGCSVPLEDPVRIQEILAAMGCPRRSRNGTTLLIPFVDMGRLDSPDCESLKAALKAAIARWYFPRLSNPDWQDGPRLEVHVDGQYLEQDIAGSLPEGIRFWQELWKAARTGIADDRFKVRSIELNNVVPCLGRLAWWCGDRKDLPILDHGGEEQQVLALVRRPGMVIRWHEADQWMPAVQEGQALAAVFVADADARISYRTPPRDIAVEEYLRACEAGNHHGWVHRQEVAGIHLGERSNFVQRLRAAIRKIADPLVRPCILQTSHHRDLGHRLGQLLIPSSFGRSSLPEGGSIAALRSHSITRPELSIESSRIRKDRLELDLELRLPARSRLVLEPRADLGGSWIDGKAWARLHAFTAPFQAEELQVRSWKVHRQPGPPRTRTIDNGADHSLREGEQDHLRWRRLEGGGWLLDTWNAAESGVVVQATAFLRFDDPLLRLGLHLANQEEEA